jgi:hypothetical protein
MSFEMLQNIDHINVTDDCNQCNVGMVISSKYATYRDGVTNSCLLMAAILAVEEHMHSSCSDTLSVFTAVQHVCLARPQAVETLVSSLLLPTHHIHIYHLVCRFYSWQYIKVKMSSVFSLKVASLS